MRERVTAFALALVLVCLSAGMASAEGELRVTQKNMYVIEETKNVLVYAKVENVGDEAVSVGAGKLVAFSEDDEIALSADYIYSSPYGLLLQPGEYAYISSTLWDTPLKGVTIADYEITMSTEEHHYEMTEAPCEVTFDVNDYRSYVYVTFTNTTDETQYDISITAALTDDEGNLLYVGSESSRNAGLPPGSTLTYRSYINSDLIDYYKEHDLTPAKADAKVHFIKEQ